MADVSRVATIRFDDTLGNFRQWTATAAVQDTAEGSSVSVSLAETSGGVPPGAANTMRLRFYNDSGTQIREINKDAGWSGSETFHFTDTGASGGSARHDVVGITIYVQRTTVVTYEAESDGTPNTPPTGFTNNTLNRGYIRGTTTLVEDISNISLGGAPSPPAAYDESLFVRLTLGSLSYVARAHTVALSHGSVSGATNSTTATTRDVTFTNVSDDRFAQAVTTVGLTVTPPDSTIGPIASTTFTSTTDDTITVDPRVTFDHHMQVNDAVYNASLDRTSRLTSDLGFLTFTATNARAAAVSGLSVRQVLSNDAGLVADPIDRTVSTTATGRPSSFATWDSSLPGGAWTQTLSIQTADADLSEVNPTQGYTLLAASPSLRVVVGSGPPISNRARHMSDAETSFVSFVGVINVDTRATLSSATTPAITSAEIALVRVNASVVAQYLSSGGVWTTVVAGTAIDFHTATETSAGSGVFTKTFTTDSTWGTHDLAVIGRVVAGGTPYGGSDKEIVVGANQAHDVAMFRLLP